jgi:hypothetical protein
MPELEPGRYYSNGIEITIQKQDAEYTITRMVYGKESTAIISAVAAMVDGTSAVITTKGRGRCIVTPSPIKQKGGSA